MSTKTKYVLFETGIEEVFYTRQFCVEVPDDVEHVQKWIRDHQDQISQSADDAEVEWLADDDVYGVPDETFDLTCDVEEEAEEWHEVVRLDEDRTDLAEEVA